MIFKNHKFYTDEVRKLCEENRIDKMDDICDTILMKMYDKLYKKK